MVSTSILGAVNERVKTDVRLPKSLAKDVERVARAMGIPKNAFYAVAAGLLIATLGPAMPGKKRTQLLQRAEKLIQKVITGALNAA